MNERDLFIAALGKPSPAERLAFLQEACAGDADLLQRVETLLREHEQLGSFLEGPVQAAPATAAGPPLGECSGTVIGPYRLLEPLGEGGMGTVYLAQQQEPVKRLVALKVIKPGMDSRQVIARFEAERQALALMDHPHIAKVLDAGTTGGEPGGVSPGRPYFVMELVQGVPITQYCDEHRLTTRARLELFVAVCQAVQHAHQKGIIHRDLKPSNVLIALYDDQPVPKVIDFGVAKATGPQLTEETLVTGFGTLVGTLEYMSPEQAELNNLDIDTRSDIYSLGVLLYELLTGTTPLGQDRLKGAGLLEALRLVREEETPRPSTRLSTAVELPRIAACRGVEPARLGRLLKGDLDWIVMKALEKDRSRRYETANALALDVQRYLHDEPVQACPPSSWYRLRKFARRNRAPVLTASAGLLLLVGGIVGTTWQAVRAEQRADGEHRAKQDAEAALAAKSRALADANTQRGIAEANGKRADQEKRIAQAVNEFFLNLLRQAYVGGQMPNWYEKGSNHWYRFSLARNPNVTVRELLDRASKQIEARFAGQELTEAAIRYTIGTAYGGLGEYRQAQIHLERSVALRTARLAADHTDTLDSKFALGRLFLEQAKYDQAESLFREAGEGNKGKHGANDPDTLGSKIGLAVVYHYQGKYDRAETMLKEVLDVARSKPGAELEEVVSKHELAAVYVKQRKYNQAESLFREVLAFLSLLGPDYPHTLTTKGDLAWVYHRQQRYDRAEKLYREALSGLTETLGGDHPSTLTVKQNLADMYCEQEKYDAARPMLEGVLAARLVKLPPCHPHTLATKYSLGVLHYHQRQYEKAIPLFEELVLVRRNGPESDSLDAPSMAFNLAANYREVGRLKEAVDLIDEWLPQARTRFGLKHPKTRYGEQVALTLCGYAATPAGRAVPPGRAVALCKELLKAQTAELGADDPETLRTQSCLGALYWRLKCFKESVPLFEEELAARKKRDPAGDHANTLKAAFNLAVNYCDAGEVKKAAQVIAEWYPRARAKRDFDNPMMKFGAQAALHTHRRANLPAEAEKVLRDLAAFWKTRDASTYTTQLGLLGLNLLEQKKYRDAEGVLRECLEIRQRREQEREYWTTFNLQSLLGGALLGQKRYQDAEPLLLTGYKGMKERQDKIPKKGRFALIQAVERLIQLYDTWEGRPDDAAKWRAELEALRRTDQKPGPPKNK
ncbi:MAG: serine/threonine-protein kinase [Gemmataceae bacterium]|nr:serine/threonine-protein kinase [Gemmataceae bacterium]